MGLVKTFYAHNELRNYSYLLFDEVSGDAWVIDPYEADPIIEYLKKNGLRLRGILNTHYHHDHIRGNGPLSEAFKTAPRKLHDGESIHLSERFSLTSMNTPGHTMDHQVFIWKDQNAVKGLFAGDTLFNSGVGNCRNGGDVNALYDTTMKLMHDLPSDTLLYPGHDYRKRNLEFAKTVEPENKVIDEALKSLGGIDTSLLHPTTLELEKKVNPFFRLNSEEIRQNVLKTATNDKDIFIKLRSMRDSW